MGDGRWGPSASHGLGALVFSALFEQFVDQVHRLQRVRREPLKTRLGMFQRGQIPFRLSPDIDVTERRPHIVQKRIKFECGHS